MRDDVSYKKEHQQLQKEGGCLCMCVYVYVCVCICVHVFVYVCYVYMRLCVRLCVIYVGVLYTKRADSRDSQNGIGASWWRFQRQCG